MEKLPIIICGEVIECDDTRENIVFEYENGFKVVLPKINERDIQKILDSRLKTGLHETSIDEISHVFQDVAFSWQGEVCETRDRAIELCNKITGFPRSLVLKDYILFTQLFTERGELYDQLDSDLGNYQVLETWLPNKDCFIHAQPYGIVTNILVGNIPIVSVFGVYRSLVVKNNTICKVPKNDPAGAIMFGLELIKKYPDHPLTKSLTIAYWEKDSVEEQKIINGSDVMCLWGGAEALSSLKKKIPSDVKIIEFGPKRSMSIVDLDLKLSDDTLEDIAYRVAEDFTVYNQEACLSPQDLYLKCSDDKVYNEFVDNLIKAFDFGLIKFPKEQIPIDTAAYVLLTRKENVFLGNKVIATEDSGWSIIFNDGKVENHPLSRTMFLHRVETLENIVLEVNKQTQTVALYPWDLQEKYRDELTLHGVDRIVGIGLTGTPRTGFTHDAHKPFSEMVRWVNTEKDVQYSGKFFSVDKKVYANLVKTMYQPFQHNEV